MKSYIIPSHKYKYAFLFIPKNACSTVLQWYCYHHQKQYDCIMAMREKENIRDDKYLKANSGYIRFVILRNPIYRFISGFCNKFIAKTLRGENETVANDVIKQIGIKKNFREVSINELIRHLIIMNNIDNINWHFALQYTQIKNYKFDYYLRFENLYNDFVSMCRKEVYPVAGFGHINKTEYKKIGNKKISYMTPNEIKLVYNYIPSVDDFINHEIILNLTNLFEKDFELYNKYVGDEK